MKITKITKTAILSTAILMMFTACQSTAKAKVIQADNYSESAEENESLELPEIVKPAEEEVEMTAEEAIKSARKKTNFLQDMFTIGNKNEVMVCDETTLFTLGISGKPAQKDAVVALNLKDGTAGFGSQYLAAYYFVQMDETARKKLAKALDNYISDFDNKRLNRKEKNSYKKYGNMTVKLHWGSVKGSTPNYGSGKMNIGYVFEKSSPYFTLSAFPVQNDYYEYVGDSTTRESMSVKYYFTKAQARDLVTMLSDENLSQYLGLTKKIVPVEADEY